MIWVGPGFRTDFISDPDQSELIRISGPTDRTGPITDRWSEHPCLEIRGIGPMTVSNYLCAPILLALIMVFSSKLYRVVQVDHHSLYDTALYISGRHFFSQAKMRLIKLVDLYVPQNFKIILAHSGSI